MRFKRYDYLIEAARDIGTKDDPCLLWPYVRIWNGYGRIKHEGKNLLVHRVAYEQFVGTIPPGYDICHICDNRLCFRVSHLFAGTRKENIRDCIDKGRFAPVNTHSYRGEKSNLATLKDREVFEIATLLKEGMLQKHIASLYGVHPPCISRIARGERWAHLNLNAPH